MAEIYKTGEYKFQTYKVPFFILQVYDNLSETHK